MSQCVKDIHRHFIFATQWTELYSPWQNRAELNGVKYLKSLAHAYWIGQAHQIIYGF
jgi:hypothetical protein